MMTCRELTDFLCDYLTGELPDHVSGTFEGHLRQCGDCREFLAQYRCTAAAGGRAFADPAARPALPEDLVSAILAAVRAMPPSDER
jgi:predicted anti-sigma-YlaC factor YlaD